MALVKNSEDAAYTINAKKKKKLGIEAMGLWNTATRTQGVLVFYFTFSFVEAMVSVASI